MSLGLANETQGLQSRSRSCLRDSDGLLSWSRSRSQKLVSPYSGVTFISDFIMFLVHNWLGKYCSGHEVLKIGFDEVKKEMLILHFQSEEMPPSLVRYCRELFYHVYL